MAKTLLTPSRPSFDQCYHRSRYGVVFRYGFVHSFVGTNFDNLFFRKLPRPLVASLLLTCRPAAVCRPVALVIIDAIKCRVWRRFTHVSAEIIKSMPTAANRNASFAIVSIVLTALVVTAVQHALPSSVQCTLFAAASEPVNDVRSVLTSTTGALSISQRHSVDFTFDTADTAALPVNNVLRVSTFGALNCCPCAELLAFDINDVSHGDFHVV